MCLQCREKVSSLAAEREKATVCKVTNERALAKADGKSSNYYRGQLIQELEENDFFVADRDTSGSPPSHILICVYVLWPSPIVGFHCTQFFAYFVNGLFMIMYLCMTFMSVSGYALCGSTGQVVLLKLVAMEDELLSTLWKRLLRYQQSLQDRECHTQGITFSWSFVPPQVQGNLDCKCKASGEQVSFILLLMEVLTL